MRSTLAIAVIFAGLAGLAGAPAHASPADLVARPLVLDKGGLELRLTMELGLRPRVRAPLSFAPDAWWGASERWTIGVIHSHASVDQFEAGATFCLRAAPFPGECRLYHGSGLDVRFGTVTGALAVAPRARLLVREIDPFKPAVTLGALVRWTAGRFAIMTDPYLRVPLANAELGNRTALSIPLWLGLQPARGWMLTARTGFETDVAVLRDGSHGPFALGVVARVGCHVDVGLEAGWSRLLGPQFDAKRGAIQLTAGWRR